MTSIPERITILEVNQINIKKQLDLIDADLKQIKYILYAFVGAYATVNGLQFFI